MVTVAETLTTHTRHGSRCTAGRVFASALAAALCGLTLVSAPPAARAANVVEVSNGIPFTLNESDHILVAKITEEAGEVNVEGPWSIWAEGKSTPLKPLNGAEKHEGEEETPKHELALVNINSAGDVGGSSTELVTDNGEERVIVRPVWFDPKGEPHEVPLLQEFFTNEKEETLHDIGLGAGIDDAGNVAATDAYQPEPGARVQSRAVIGPGSGTPSLVGAADLVPGTQSAAYLINASGEVLGTVQPNEEGAGKSTYYLWPTPSSSGTQLNFDLPYSLANDGSVLGERAGNFFLRTPDGKETAVKGLEKPYRINSSHIAVGYEMVGGVEHAAQWQAGAVTDLNNLLPKGSGWVLNRASAINDGGDIVGVGEHEGHQEGFLLEAGAATATQLSCAATSEAEVARCTAQVSDKSGEPALKAPTGSVAFTAAAASGPVGSLKEPSCALKASVSPGLAECSVLYKHATPGSGGPVTITAAYSGDSNFAPSNASLTQCGGGEVFELGSVSWVGRHDHGLEIGHEAVIHGCGLAAGMKVRWGNDLATETLAAGEILDGGATANVTIPWEATSGKFSVSDGETTATLSEELTVDSWRNTEGLNFPNYAASLTRQEMVDAFAEPIFTPEHTLPPGYERFYDSILASAGKKGHGRCFGFAVLTSQFADGSVNPDRFGTAATPFGLTKASVEETIGIDWWKQYAVELRPYQEGEPTSTAAIHARLSAAFGANGFTHPVVLSYFWSELVPTPAGGQVRWHGHAVSAFGIRDDYPHKGEFTIYTYNSNVPIQPGEDSPDGAIHREAQINSMITVDRDGEWAATGEGPEARGAPNLLEVTPIAALESPVHLTRSQRTVTTFLPPSTGVLGVSDPSTGKPVNLQVGGSGGVTLNSQIDATAPPADSYTGPGVSGVSSIDGPAGDWKETLGSTGKSLGAEWLGPRGGASIEAGKGYAATDFNSATGALSLAPAAGQPVPSTAGLQLYSAYGGGAAEHVLTLSGPLVGAKVKASFTRRGAVQISTVGAAKMRVELSVAGHGTSSQTFDLGTISLPKNSTLTAAPSSWGTLAHARVAGHLRAGRHSRRLKFKNHLRWPQTRILKRAISSGTLKLLLALPALNPSASSVTISAVAKHGSKKVAMINSSLAPNSSRRQAVTLKFPKAPPRGSSVTVTVMTATGGTTPSSSKTSASLRAR